MLSAAQENSPMSVVQALDRVLVRMISLMIVYISFSVGSENVMLYQDVTQGGRVPFSGLGFTEG